jgi:DNA polymerase
MEPTGEGSIPILFVAEAPGKTEDEEGTQLVGEAGQYTREVLDELGLDLEECMKTNAVICRPPRNKTIPLHIECCRPKLLETVRKVKPRVIVLMGGSAVRSFLPTVKGGSAGRISKWVGWQIPSHEHQAWICPTFHPSFILRMNKNPVLERLFKNHLKDAIQLTRVPPQGVDFEWAKTQVETITHPRLARKRLKDLAKKKGVLAFDYESTGIKPDHPKHAIVAVSFCLDGQDTFAIRLNERMMQSLSQVLKNPDLKKVASNLKHEERWTQRKLGHGVVSWHWDTLLTAHYLDNRGGITSLKFQTFVNFGVADYNAVVSHYFKPKADGFNSIFECPIDDLLLYNGLDSLFTYMVMERQKEQCKWTENRYLIRRKR